jgi:hypothetical protein
MISIDEQYVHNSCSRSPPKSNSPNKKRRMNSKLPKKRCKTPFDSTMVVDGHLMPIRVNRKSKGHCTFRSGQKEKSNQNGANWSKRETNWFKFERR